MGKSKEKSIIFLEFFTILREKVELMVGDAAVVGHDIFLWQSAFDDVL